MRKAIFSVAIALVLMTGSATAFADGPNYQQPGGGNTGDGSNSSGQSTTSMPPSTNTYRTSVAIRNMKFTPTSLTVWQGTTVTWMNQDNINHTVTSDDMTSNIRFDSGALQPGQNYSYTFSQTGVYTYHCAIHPQMTGSVTVISQPQQPAPPTQNPSQSGSSSPSVSAQASANATVNNYNCTSQRSQPTAAPTTGYHATPDYSRPMAPTYTTKASVSAPASAPTTTEQSLPSTGPAGTLAIAAAATSLGTGGSYIYLLKRKKLS